ncbi:unnamed protein product [Pieris brassicae]|uniref:Uncharacterized protein n=1 Tax=Pieris brassicae TaxID=7116 RepID=A0A9P0TJG0_PIEBR|nr:unnamed protein product [Pieris brassicae]
MDESDIINPLPPILCNNPRQKVNAEKISIRTIYKEKHEALQELNITQEKPPQPVPLHPLHLIFSPDHLCLELHENTVISKLRYIFKFKTPPSKVTWLTWVWNPSDRTIYVKLCGLWDESARFGASWWCYPRTRFLLVPGFNGTIYIKARPRISSPIPFANIALQLAASHLRDNVVGYFVIPIFVRFSNYVPPPVLLGEE